VWFSASYGKQRYCQPAGAIAGSACLFFCMLPALILPQRKTGSKKTKASLKMLGCRLSLFLFSDLRFRKRVRSEMQSMIPEL
jgi:hypothetical protein